MDQRHAVVGQDVGAVVGVGQAHLILADRLMGGDAAVGHPDPQHRLPNPADGHMIADPVAGVGALLLWPEGDDGLGTQHARNGRVEAQAPRAQASRPLQDRPDQEWRAIQLQVQLVQLDAAGLGQIAGAQGEVLHLRRLGVRVQRQPGAGGVQRQLQALRTGLAALRRQPGLAGDVEIGLGRDSLDAPDRYAAGRRIEGGL